jgi:hypothetical protein
MKETSYRPKKIDKNNVSVQLIIGLKSIEKETMYIQKIQN